MTRRKVPLPGKLPFVLCLVAMAVACAVVGIAQSQSAQQAPAGYGTPIHNDQSGAQGNGMINDGNATFRADEAVFMEEEDESSGLGPVYNARSCVDCHAQPNIGGTSQVTELRVGHRDAAGNFVNPNITVNDGAVTIPGRSLVNDRSLCAEATERVAGTETIHALRATTSVLGDGFVEAIDSNTLIAIANAQPRQSGGRIAGMVVQVPVSEANGALRVGRFGWKATTADLAEQTALALERDIGLSTTLFPQSWGDCTARETSAFVGGSWRTIFSHWRRMSSSTTCGLSPSAACAVKVMRP